MPTFDTAASSRFDYIRYDQMSADAQESLKKKYQEIEAMVAAHLPDGRAKSLCLTALEESYMWTGKGIRDSQIARDSLTAHVPERTNA